MKRPLYLFFLLILFSSCEYNEIEEDEEVNSTVLMFFPWSTNLKSYFDQNIRDFSTAIASEGLHGERVLVCIETTPNEASIIELKKQGSSCVYDTLYTYTNTRFTTVDGLVSMFQRIKNISQTEDYSMIIGCHGMGWLPAAGLTRMIDVLHLNNLDATPLTRYFGGLSAQYQIEISTLADALKNSGIKLEYLLFDDCYMSSVETAYILKDVTDHIIACPTEVMSYGFPYHKCGKYLLGTPNYDKVCSEFYNFYINYESPYGTIAVTDCSELDNLANVVRDINLYAAKSVVNIGNVQKMDGYSPTIFFDLEDEVRNKCSNDELFERFSEQLNKTIISKAHTERYYAASIVGTLPITTYCGITTSDGSSNYRTESYSSTDWYVATH